MPPKLFRITWPDQAVSVVSVGLTAKGRAEVQIRGSRERLTSLLDYRTMSAIEVELRYIVEKARARMTEEQA